MHHAIAYVSTKSRFVSDEEIEQILNKSYKYNNANSITGILLYSEGNFFQLIEGKKEKIEELYYLKIEKDPRHKDIIQFLEKEITNPAYDGYLCDIVPSRFHIDADKLERYIDYIKVLEPEKRKVVELVLKSFIKI